MLYEVTIFLWSNCQGIPFLIDCLNANANRNDCYFVVIGAGTELPKLKQWYSEKQPKSVRVMDGSPYGTPVDSMIT